MAVIVIEEWMVQDENLKSRLDLLNFALIHGCSQKGNGSWHGGYTSLAERTGGTRTGVIRSINTLIQKGYLAKAVVSVDGTEKTSLFSLKCEGGVLSTPGSVPSTPGVVYSVHPIENYKDSYEEKELKERESIERIYKIYPSKCPISNRSTGKCSKDKDRIARLLKTHSEEELTRIIKLSLEDSMRSKSWIKNFSTFLNNLPDISELEVKQEYGANPITTLKFSDPGMYVGEDGRIHTSTPYPTLEALDAAIKKGFLEYQSYLHNERNS